MSIYMEIVNEFDISPFEVRKKCDSIINEPVESWELPTYDILDVWGSMDLRQAFGLLTGGDTPTAYSKRMADALKVILDRDPSLLGFNEEPINADFTRTQQVLNSIREPIDAEVVDG